MATILDRFPAANPNPDDMFTRLQVIDFLEEVPLGYRTEQEHERLEAFVMRAQEWFSRLSTNYSPSHD